ncbi:MAG: hypothetical protein E6R03_10225 [Hyphomicrobiaceae bacterium]|nr:MAG: hypothetical protein E6R03_10225 [Hyphomicrobiaceae bacterium]
MANDDNDWISDLPKRAEEPSTLSPAEQAKVDKLNEKVPGLDLTYGNLLELDLTEEDALRFAALKQQYGNTLHLVRTVRKAYLVRECKQIEWRNKVLEIQSDLQKARSTAESQGKDPEHVEKTLDMIFQEKVISWLLVEPKMEAHELRATLPPGEVETLFNCVMMAQGYNQRVVPIKL